ncbi:MAG: peptidoglycan DD-metalloendopeptidase family protein [Firmicutes bacterium]|jgi:murein DD-endopeptidase MepM/ murein hydrolase activator NlpD|nr:peptidoglycan DD-metalloendopeptidase family protein [Bacillota bacterium]
MRRLIIPAVLVIVLFVPSIASGADNSTTMRQVYNEVQTLMADMEAELEALENQQEALVQELKVEQQQLETVQEQTAEIETALEQVSNEITSLKAELKYEDETVEVDSEYYQETLAQLNKTVDLAAKSVAPLSKSSLFFDYLLYVGTRTHYQAAEQYQAGHDRMQSLQETLADLEKTQEQLQAELTQYQEKEEAGRRALAAKQQESAELHQQVSELKRSVYRQASAAWHLERQLKAKLGFVEFVWPLAEKGRISSEYGMRFHPIYEEERFHTGVDFAVNSGVPIRAAAEGTVVVSEDANGYGLTVVIEHGDGLSTLYAHASKLLVKPGQKVRAGETIALVGSTGLSTGPHLHFEVRQDQQHVDPWIWLS